MKDLNKLQEKMIAYYAGDPARIQHFIKVHAFARMIGQAESLDAQTLFILETAALTHDIGIKPSEEKYGSSAGQYQELEGPPVAQEMLMNLGFDAAVIRRVCYLIGHHHTYTNIDGEDYQILVEADFLVNLYEDRADAKTICAAYRNIFRTTAGKRLCRTIFGVKE